MNLLEVQNIIRRNRHIYSNNPKITSKRRSRFHPITSHDCRCSGLVGGSVGRWVPLLAEKAVVAVHSLNQSCTANYDQ